MAWRIEKNGDSTDIVIDGWEKAIADDPHEGIADMRNISLLSVPKEAAVAFANKAITLPPIYTSVSFTVAAATDIFTVSTTAGFYTGMAIIINTLSGGTGLSASAGSNVYYVTTITATTFQVSKNFGTTSILNVTLDGSGTLSTAQFGQPVDSVDAPSSTFDTNGRDYKYPLILDSNGLVWYVGNGPDGGGLNVLQFCGNTNHSSVTNPGSLGICAWKGYLFVFEDSNIDYIKLTDLFGTTGPFGHWHIAWQSVTGSNAGHKAIAATDDAMYFCNGTAVGALLQNVGVTFDPTNTTTYTYDIAALQLPTFDYATCLAQLGTTLLVGAISSFIYPWDRTSTSFNYPLIVAESYIKNIVSTNSIAYIFAGNRGRIYITNGANVQEFKKFPDQLSGTETPYYNWGGAIYLRNQLYFGISATTNGNSAVNNFSGVWALDLTNTSTPKLYMLNSLSTGSYAGSVPVLLEPGVPNTQAGNGVLVGWIDGSGNGGIDTGSTSPYTNYEAYIDTDIIPVGTYLNPNTDSQIEYKLSKPLVSGESIRIAWRGNLTDSFTTVATFTTIGQVSDITTVNFQNQQWIQLRVSMSSTASSPSYDRLKEIRILDAQ